MQRIVLLSTSLFILISLLVACGGETSENAFPKKVPVDQRAQKEQIEVLSNSDFVYKDWAGARQNIETLLEGNSSYYQTNNGTDAMTAEYTTYYLEEEKQTPIKTVYTYKTGNFDIVYWLPNGQVWLEKNNYHYLIEGDEIIRTMRQEEEVNATSVEQEEVLKLLTKARKEITPVTYHL